jgi:uracil-DNA glycosylase family 4
MRRKVQIDDEEEDRKARRRRRLLERQGGEWPLNAPGMPPPGPDFMKVAHALGDDTVFVKQTKKADGRYEPGQALTELYSRALREPGFPLAVHVNKTKTANVEFIPGHVWGQHAKAWANEISDPHFKAPPVDGPHRADVFVIGKMPWKEEQIERRNLVGPSGQLLTEVIRKVHIKNAHRWYVTNLVKFVPPTDDTRLRAGWIADCLPLLHMELRIVRPRYILCLGADASKALLGAKFGVGYMEGRVVEYEYPVHQHEDDAPCVHKALVMSVLHPAEAVRTPDKARVVERGLSRFALLSSGQRFDLEERDLDHRLIDTLEDAQDLVNEINYEFKDLPRKDRLVAWDAEWQGQHPMNDGAYLRTIQISWDEKKAACFKVRHQGGKLAFRDRDGKPAFKRLARLLNAFMADKRACGHFLVSDLEWLHYNGIDPIAGCPVPLADDKRKLAWERLRDGEGWLDTAMMRHAIEETAPLGLESVAMSYTMAPRYDIPLEDWKKAYCQERGIKAGALEGYGDCPDKVLVPYANYDADVSLRITRQLSGLLDRDYEGNCCWEPFWESMIAQKVILRIHKNGILVDRERIDYLTRKFMAARTAQEDTIRKWAEWPKFNVRSVQHVKEFLFGEQYNGKRDEKNRPIRIRPPGAKILDIEPLLDTSKPPRRWRDLVERNLHKDASPGTGKMVLGILMQDNEPVRKQIGWLRDYRFLDQVLKSVLRNPRVKEEADDSGEVGEGWAINDDGFLEYDAGLAASIDADGRVRTHLYPTAETGRWKSARPNLQNISKSRDPDYERMLGRENYKWKLRSVLKASPGFAFIEFDYKGAELYGMSLMAGAQAMRDHCERANTYPEEGYGVKGRKAKKGHACPGDCKKCRKAPEGWNPREEHACGGGCSLCGYAHPEYYDIHSNVARLAFQLDCHPSKFGLELIKKTHFRTLAKNVIFGIAYGRGAKAIALSAREQGVNVTSDEAQLVIDTIFAMYPELVPFFESAKTRARDDKWLCHCFGRLRRFPTAADYKLEGEFERQAMNFPIQGMIASAVDRGLAWLDHVVSEQGLEDDIRLLLQIHDAGLVECRYELVPHAMKLIRWAMVDMVQIWPTDLAGVPRGDGPYHLGLDFSVERHWSERLSDAEKAELGIAC